MGIYELDIAFSQCQAIQVTRGTGFYAMQSDGDFVQYGPDGSHYWSTGSAGRGTPGDYRIVFQADGNLVIYDIKGVAIWYTATKIGAPNAFRLYPYYWVFISNFMYLKDKSLDHTIWSTRPGASVYSAELISLRESGYCLDTGGQPGAAMLYQCNSNNNQLWNVLTSGQIIDASSGEI